MIDPNEKEKQTKDAEELSDEELDNVSGGGLNPEQEGQGGYTPPKKP